MAIDLNFKFTNVSQYQVSGAEDATPGLAEDITTSGTSQTLTGSAPVDCICVVEAWGSGSAWVTFGATPTAAVGTTHLITAPDTRTFGGIKAGWKAAVIDDS